jgi:N-acyl homoserine lactone hydrolase
VVQNRSIVIRLRIAHIDDMTKPTLLTLCTWFAVSGCHAASHPATAADLGRTRPVSELVALLDQPGPIVVESVASADWAVDREGLINLDHSKAEAANLESGPEPIKIYFHALHHPTKGLFVVDTGVEHSYRDAPSETRVSWLIRQVMDPADIRVRMPLGEYLKGQPSRLRGVFLTHLHLDHIMGMPDVADETPVYAGPNEAEDSHWTHLVTRGSIDDHLAGKHALREFAFAPEPNAPLHAVLDLFGDGSLWAIWVPGHTEGSVAYLARTPTGPVLMTGDACHTRWGWDNQVEPGTFSTDQERSAESLLQLVTLVKQHPKITVRLGHQE